MTNKVRENRLRRMAVRQGLALHKNRMRDPLGLEFGTYLLMDLITDVQISPVGCGLTLDEVEQYLLKPRSKSDRDSYQQWLEEK